MIKKYFLIAIPIILWGSTPAVGKILVGSMSGMNIFFYASLIASFCLMLIVLLRRQTKQLLETFSANNFIIYPINGLLIFLYYFFLYKALFYLTAQDAFIINYLWPIMAVFATALLLKEKFTKYDFFGLIISFVGVYIIATKGQVLSFEPSNIKGILFALADAVAYGIFTAVGKKSKADKFISTLHYYFFGCIIAFIILLFSKTLLISLGSEQLKYLIWLGVFPYAMAISSWFIALENFKTAKVANLIYLTPFVSLIYIRVLVGETISVVSIAGLLFIVTGIFFQNYKALFSSRKTINVQ